MTPPLDPPGTLCPLCDDDLPTDAAQLPALAACPVCEAAVLGDRWAPDTVREAGL